MLKRKRLGFLLLAGALLLALFYWWPRGADTPSPEVAAGEPETASPMPKRMQAPEPVARPPMPPLEAAHASVQPAPSAKRGRFTGQVRSAGSNALVPGAELVFSHQGSAESVSADAEGSFVFEPSALGNYQLAMASAEGFFAYAPEWEQSPVAMVARPKMSVEGIVVYLIPAIDYQGRVVDADGRGVAGAKVLVSTTAEGVLAAEESELKSDADGAFVFNARDYSMVRAAKGKQEGYSIVDPAVQISHKLVVVLGDEPNPVGPIVTRRLHGEEEEEEAGDSSLRGKVVDASGKPVPAFNVMLTRRAGIANRPVAQNAVFDGHGEFQFDGLRAGAYRVHVAASGWAMTSADANADVGGGPEIIVTLGAGSSVFGQVIDGESKEPLALAKVSIESSFGGGSSARPMLVSAVTDEAGNFELRGLRAGRRSVVVAAANHHSKIVSALEVVEGERTGPLQVELAPVGEGEQPRLDLAGIGVALGQSEDAMLVRDVIPEGGAAEAGILAQDLIVAIDGETVSALGWDDAIQRIRGPVGSQVQLRLRRGADELTLVVTRKAIRN